MPERFDGVMVYYIAERARGIPELRIFLRGGQVPEASLRGTADVPIGLTARNTGMTLVETAIAYNNKAEPWQGTADTGSLYVLTGSLLLAFIAFVILERVPIKGII